MRRGLREGSRSRLSVPRQLLHVARGAGVVVVVGAGAGMEVMRGAARGAVDREGSGRVAVMEKRSVLMYPTRKMARTSRLRCWLLMDQIR